VNRSKLAALSAGAMFLVASVIVPATALAAGTGSVSLSSANVGTSTGSSFFLDINTQASVAMSGASASIDFDRTKLQIVSVALPTVGTGWNVAGAAHVTPSVAAIGTANVTGHLSAIGAFFTDGTSSLPAATNEVLARVTFFATATGNTNIVLPSGGTEPAALLDGTAASYGSPVVTTPSGTAVAITAGTGGGTTTTTNVTGTVDSGFVALTCPTGVVIPLARNVNNVANFECQIGSNVTWTLSAIDTNADPLTHGYMRDTVQVPPVHLHDSLFVHANPHLDASNNTIYDSDVNLAGSPSAQPVANGQNNVNQPLAFTQFAEPNDVAGNYGSQILFSIVSSF
jgi:hypothetical protein